MGYERPRMLNPDLPALVLAPMEGITDAPMRALQGETGAFSYAVSEFVRVTADPIPRRVFYRDIPELAHGCLTPTGLPVQIQILGGDAERMGESALAACEAGAKAIDINFGCPAKTVNRHDGGASLLKYPTRIREIVSQVRQAVPADIPVSAKLRLGWESIDDIHENAAMAAEGGASWLTIHARTRLQGYTPPVYWKPIGEVRRRLGLPVIANGDIWTFEDFLRCREQTGAMHFMIGRSALANPSLSYQIATELKINRPTLRGGIQKESDWLPLLQRLVTYTEFYEDRVVARSVARLKQWLKLAANHGHFPHFDAIKLTTNTDEFFANLRQAI